MDFDVDGAIEFLAKHAELINMSTVDLFLKKSASVIPSFFKCPEIFELDLDDLVRLASSIYSQSFSPKDLEIFGPELQDYLLNAQKYSIHNHLRHKNVSETAGGKQRGKNERKSEKKRHEIDRLGNLILSQAPKDRKAAAVDFGAGQGYLSQLLADAGWDVVALERDDGQCHGSVVRQGGSQNSFRVVQLNINENTTVEEIRTASCIQEGIFTCFCSLHACGSLSIDQIRLFLQDPATEMLASVGCCYNLMRSEDCPPLSQKLAQSKYLLGFMKERSARMLACQAPWRWSSRPEQSKQSFVSNHYRALFQAYILPHLPPHDADLGHLPTSSLNSFQEYVKQACQKLNVICPQMDPEEIERLHTIKETAVVWTLRALLGPVIESVLLLDRLYLVRESLPGQAVELLPIFDPIQSPRNFVLFSRRT